MSTSEKATLENELIRTSSKDAEECIETTSTATPPSNSKEIYKQAWSQKLLKIAYLVLVVTAFCETFAGDSTSSFNSYATSSFESHSLISTVAVVYKITAIITYPIWAKIYDLVYRHQGFGIAFLFYTLAYVLYAACNTIGTYFVAELFYAIGLIGYRMFQQVTIANMTSLINRGLLAQFPDAIAAIPALYVGSVIQDAFLDHSTWRWGYGVWAIIMAFCATCLTAFMFVLDRAAKRHGEVLLRTSLKDIPEGPLYKKVLYFLFVKLDLFGGLLLAAGCTLLFVPLTLTGKSSSYKWHEAKLIAMLVVGFVLLVLCALWCMFVAKHPYIPYPVLTKKSVLLCFTLVALDWCANSAFATFQVTVLQVAKGVSAGEATRIDNTKKVCFQVFSIVCGVAMKYTHRSKVYVLLSVPFYFLGQALLVHFMNTDGDVGSKGLLYLSTGISGAGRGFSQCAMQVITQAVAGKQNSAISTAFFLMFNSVGSLIGTCISGGIWNSTVLTKLARYLPAAEKKNAKKIFKNIKVAMKYKKGSETRLAINRAYRETQQTIGWATVGIIGVELILMWFLDNVVLTSHLDVYADDTSSEEEIVQKDADQSKGKLKGSIVRADSKMQRIKNFFGV